MSTDLNNIKASPLNASKVPNNNSTDSDTEESESAHGSNDEDNYKVPLPALDVGYGKDFGEPTLGSPRDTGRNSLSMTPQSNLANGVESSP
jgi:hypothetical protein